MPFIDGPGGEIDGDSSEDDAAPFDDDNCGRPV